MRRAVAGLAVAGLILGTGCGSSGRSDRDPQTRLDRPAAVWTTFKRKDRTEAVKDCRLAAAVRAATPDHAPAMPYFSDRYRAIQRLDVHDVGLGLDRLVAGAASRDQTLGQACTAVAFELADITEVARRPHVEFSLPVAARRGPYTLTIDTPMIRLAGRVVPSGARLTLERPPDRSATRARWTIARAGDAFTIDLHDVPLGVSYLNVVVGGPTGRSERLLSITRRRPSNARPPRTFQPFVIHGDGPKTFSVLDIPTAATATVRSTGPLLLSSSRTLLLTHTGTPVARRTAIAPALYRDVRIAAAGPWTLRLAPRAARS